MTSAQFVTLLTATTALVVAIGHAVADLTGLLDASRARRAARKGRPAA